MSAVDRTTYTRSTKQGVASSSDMAASYLRVLKARGATVGVWEVRGRVFARVMRTARDARLSGAEWSVLATVALHLQHLGRSKGMMRIGSLADDCMVTERTVRNALRVLSASEFLSVKYRPSGQIILMLDRRFGPKAVVPVDKSVDKSPLRCAPRKKISTTGNSTFVELPVKRECKDSAQAATAARRESPASSPNHRTANGNGNRCRCGHRRADHIYDEGPCRSGVVCHCTGHDPPRKRA